MTKVRRAGIALVAAAVVAVAAVGGGTAASEQARTVTIGWAYDSVGSMAPFDGPALATAKSHIATVNKKSPIKLRLLTCDTQAEIGRIWDGLVVGGKPQQSGWLRDRYGLCRQIVPRRSGELTAGTGPAPRG